MLSRGQYWGSVGLHSPNCSCPEVASFPNLYGTGIQADAALVLDTLGTAACQQGTDAEQSLGSPHLSPFLASPGC